LIFFFGGVHCKVKTQAIYEGKNQLTKHKTNKQTKNKTRQDRKQTACSYSYTNKKSKRIHQVFKKGFVDRKRRKVKDPV